MNKVGYLIVLLIIFLLAFYVNVVNIFSQRVEILIEGILGIIFFSIFFKMTKKSSIFSLIINKINKSINGEVSPYIFAIFRIIFGIFSFKMIYHSYDFIEVVRYNFNENLINILQYLYYPTLLSIVFIIIGLGGRIPYLINFLGSLYLHGDVGTSLYMAISFWILFMGTDNVLSIKFPIKYNKLDKIINYSPKPMIWPSVLLGVNVGFLITSAGISKLLDPVWYNNMGFYYTYLQPWIKVQHLNFILDYEALMVFMNWATIITEIIVLPLMLFRKTRFYAGIFTFLMFAILTYPIRIDAIGPFGMLIGLIIIFSSIKVQIIKSELVNNMSYFPSILFLFLIFSILGVTQLEFLRNNIKYPKLNVPFTFKNDKYIDNTYYKGTIYNIPYINPISIFRIYSLYTLARTPLGWYSPFNNGHFFGRIIYKVGIKQNEEIIFPFEIFNDDGTMKTTKYSGRILFPRVLQNRIFALEMLKISVAQNRNINFLPKESEKSIEKLSHFYKELFLDMGYNFKSIHIFYKPIYVPSEYQGNINPCINLNWVHFLDYNFENRKFSLVNIPTKMDLQRYEFPFFEDDLLVPNPNYYGQ